MWKDCAARIYAKYIYILKTSFISSKFKKMLFASIDIWKILKTIKITCLIERKNRYIHTKSLAFFFTRQSLSRKQRAT